MNVVVIVVDNVAGASTSKAREYLLLQTDLWEKTTKDMPQKTKRIGNDKVLNHIRLDPYRSEPLHCELKGLWSYNRIGNGNRVVFAICEDCRERGLESLNSCRDCSAISDNTIVLFAFDGHDVYDWLRRARRRQWKKVGRTRRRKKKGKRASRSTGAA